MPVYMTVTHTDTYTGGLSLGHINATYYNFHGTCRAILTFRVVTTKIDQARGRFDRLIRDK